METNLFRNSNFSLGEKYWGVFTSISANSVSFPSNEGTPGRCAKMAVSAQKGLAGVSHSIKLEGGRQYTITFDIKRSGSVDFWIQLLINGQYHNSSSFISQLSSTYKKLEYTFTVPATSGYFHDVTVFFIAGSAAGTIWLDNPSIIGQRFLDTSYFVSTGSNARLYRSAAASDDNYGVFPEGACFILEGVSGNYARVKFGNKYGETISAYIPLEECWPTTIAVPYPFVSRAKIIAESLVGATGPNLGLGGSYCQNFIYWLCGASGQAPSSEFIPYPTRGDNTYELCGPTRRWFENNGWYTRRSEFSAYRPVAGGFLYYKGDTDDENSHVGFIISGDGSNFVAIEGNASNNQVKKVTGNFATGSHDVHSRIIEGIAYPAWDG